MAQALRSVPTPQSSPMPMAAAVWPIPGDVPDLSAIIDDQARTIAAQAVLIDAYQANLNAVQSPSPGTAATGTGTTSGSSTTLSVNSTGGVIKTGAVVADSGNVLVPVGTTVLGQISGTVGGTGSYLLSAPVNIATATALTFTPPPPAFGATWPTPTDAPTLLVIQQTQSGLLRLQSALIQNYEDLLNVSQTPAPPTGP